VFVVTVLLLVLFVILLVVIGRFFVGKGFDLDGSPLYLNSSRINSTIHTFFIIKIHESETLRFLCFWISD